MKINYKPNFITQNIDLKKLRPGNSYGNLQKNRNSILLIIKSPQVIWLKEIVHLVIK